MHKFSKDKIKGAMYGLAVGDAMGITTEFLSPPEIKYFYKNRTDIIGKGWLNLKPGDVTDPTEMALCACNALDMTLRTTSSKRFYKAFLNACCQTLVEWLDHDPIDVETCCRHTISHCRDAEYQDWIDFSQESDPEADSNLFRCIPLILTNQTHRLILAQSRLTHNNAVADKYVKTLCRVLLCCLKDETIPSSLIPKKASHLKSRNISNTVNDALYYSASSDSFEDCILEIVNQGGDTASIAALAGSLLGARHGFSVIPERWICQLNPSVVQKLDYYIDIIVGLHNAVC